MKNDCNEETVDSKQLQKLFSVVKSILTFEDLNEELLHRLVEVIEVKDNSEVTIHYQFMNPLSVVV
ncbi:DUF4368 domain-containing protein [Peribacillus asahii]|uniref:DUF4368 domain-containing protein n=1 Tax=Peribacillus asahii TaxID=228899 RepID=UPI000FDB1C8E|nr:DUF4368 domain-containing protein [Peribacillus asahii]USK83236.1 DUF4368 domain-containing protein [Peribacillus asahii]